MHTHLGPTKPASHFGWLGRIRRKPSPFTFYDSVYCKGVETKEGLPIQGRIHQRRADGGYTVYFENGVTRRCTQGELRLVKADQ